ncbi:MAG: RNA methyltransferase [Clostridia bacterium]|nr:RNA methyltransferase [Clostridia bacterium]
MNIITNAKNKIIRKAISLYTPRGRREHSLFPVEGVRAVTDALARGARCDFLLVAQSAEFEALKSEVAYVVSDEVFRSLSDTINPQGVFGAFEIPKTQVDETRGAVVLCDNVRDPGNVGTIIRTADAVGCGGVIFSKGCADVFGPKAVRSSMSGILSVPIKTDADLAEEAENLKKRGITVVATMLSANSVSLYESQLQKNCAFIIGSEAEGVSEKLAAKADMCVRIPMRSHAESLNAAVACAVVLYEHLRRNLV